MYETKLNNLPYLDNLVNAKALASYPWSVAIDIIHQCDSIDLSAG